MDGGQASFSFQRYGANLRATLVGAGKSDPEIIHLVQFMHLFTLEICCFCDHKELGFITSERSLKQPGRLTQIPIE
ncbi:MAG: hypothetical protein ABI171_15590 [Collimonas sp.]|uniref:hypothetical protein n=1 Tax=Collimonas sp. TaxID=1963772 RepID=UPI0032666EEF